MSFFGNNNSESVSSFSMTSPVRGESKIIEWDYDRGGFSVFGRKSGHVYGNYETAGRAQMHHPEAD